MGQCLCLIPGSVLSPAADLWGQILCGCVSWAGETIGKGEDWGKFTCPSLSEEGVMVLLQQKCRSKAARSFQTGAGNLAFGYKFCFSSVGLNFFRIVIWYKRRRKCAAYP